MNPKTAREWAEAILAEQPLGQETLAETIEKIIRQAEDCPGTSKCPKCGFMSFRNVIFTGSGTMCADPTVADHACPNDGELMRPMTWKERCHDISTACESQIHRAIKAEDELASLKKLLDEP